MKSSKKLKLGELLIREGYITEEQLKEVLSVQKKLNVYKPLGEVCVDLKFVSRADLGRVLRKHNNRIYLGDLMVNLGLITPEELRMALEEQKASGGRLGELLIKKGFLTETNLVNALSMQLGVPKILPDINLIDKSLLEGINAAFLKKNEALPAFRHGDSLTVILANPFSKDTIHELELFFRCKIEPAIASSKDILNGIDLCYKTIQFEGEGVSRKSSKTLIVGDSNDPYKKQDSTAALFNYIISNAIQEEASDIHIEPLENRLRIRYRLDGILHHKTDLPAFMASNLISHIKVACGLDIAEKRRHQDGRVEARIMDKNVDLRVSTYASVYGESVVIRALHRQNMLIDLESQGFSPTNIAKYKNILEHSSGITIVTGPTGCGKTTTLYASINSLNGLHKAIITVEDPVEYTIDGVVQGQLEHKLGHSYMDFIKSMMRQDPDVLMIGEIRDKVAAEAVVQASLTGHKVLCTFHTDDTTGALLRLINMDIDTFLIASTVDLIVSQRLVRVLCTHCREPYLPGLHELSSFNVRLTHPDKFEFYQARGCSLCNGTGFKGRMALHELLVVNDAIREAVMEKRNSIQIRLIAREKAQLVPLREDGFYKAIKGITSLDEVNRVAFHNESDSLSTRTAEEIVAMCEGEEAVDSVQNKLYNLPQKVLPSELRAAARLNAARQTESGGEVFRIRFDCSTIEAEAGRIARLFKAHQDFSEKVGRTVDTELLEDFTDLIIRKVKSLKYLRAAEFVEFSIRLGDEAVRLCMETLVPGKGCRPVLSRERGLQLLSYMGREGEVEEIGEAESESVIRERPPSADKSLIWALACGEQRGREEDADNNVDDPLSELPPAEGSKDDKLSSSIGSGSYERYFEEIDFANQLSEVEKE